MIEINLYNNGYEIYGHANQVTCSEVSILAWAIGNTLCKIDFNSKWHDEHGYTYLFFDTSIEKAKWIFDDYKHNAKIWGQFKWKDSDVKIVEYNKNIELREDLEDTWVKC